MHLKSGDRVTCCAGFDKRAGGTILSIDGNRVARIRLDEGKGLVVRDLQHVSAMPTCEAYAEFNFEFDGIRERVERALCACELFEAQRVATGELGSDGRLLGDSLPDYAELHDCYRRAAHHLAALDMRLREVLTDRLQSIRD